MRVSIYGLGKLGSSLAAAVASKGHSVVGVDVDDHIVSQVNQGTAPFPEPELQEYFAEHGDRIIATADASEALDQTEVSFVLVPTPSQADGSFDNAYVYAVWDSIAEALSESDEFHLLVLSSTVSPTSMQEFEEYLEAETGGTSGVDWGLCYNPCFIAQGTIIRDFLNPRILLMGQSDDSSGRKLLSFWESVIETDPTVTRMEFINAELAKIIFNVFSTMKISFANQISMVCGQYEDANVDVVMDSIVDDERIGGKKLFKGGLGFGGPCLPRDNRAFQAFAEAPPELDMQQRTDQVNDAVPVAVEETVVGIASLDDTVGILGLTYKPDTHITRESQSLEIASRLADRGYDVVTYDPMAEERTIDSLERVLEDASVLLLLTPWEEFANVEASRLRQKTVLDVWRLHYPELADHDGYYAWGVDVPNAFPDV